MKYDVCSNVQLLVIKSDLSIILVYYLRNGKCGIPRKVFRYTIYEFYEISLINAFIALIFGFMSSKLSIDSDTCLQSKHRTSKIHTHKQVRSNKHSWRSTYLKEKMDIPAFIYILHIKLTTQFC